MARLIRQLTFPPPLFGQEPPLLVEQWRYRYLDVVRVHWLHPDGRILIGRRITSHRTADQIFAKWDADLRRALLPGVRAHRHTPQDPPSRGTMRA